MPGPGYHIRYIPKGTLGTTSKIREEVYELEDAEEQGVAIMCLCELADIIGAVDAYLAAKFPGTTIDDLVKMHAVTKRAFENGRRS